MLIQPRHSFPSQLLFTNRRDNQVQIIKCSLWSIHPQRKRANPSQLKHRQNSIKHCWYCCSIITYSNPALTFDYLCSQNSSNTYWYRFMKSSMRKKEENEMIISSPLHLCKGTLKHQGDKKKKKDLNTIACQKSILATKLSVTNTCFYKAECH